MATTTVQVIPTAAALNNRRYQTRSRTLLSKKMAADNGRLSLASIQNKNKAITETGDSKIPVRAVTKKAPTCTASQRGTLKPTKACDRKAEGKRERGNTTTTRGETTSKSTTINLEPTKPVTPDIPEVDGYDADPQQCHEYVKDIYRYLRVCERDSCYHISASFLDHQEEVTEHHRAVVIDWLVLVVKRFRLLQESLYLAVDIMDRYLQAVSVPKNEIQLLGITALFVASKYEEIYPPSIREFSYITADSYSTNQIRELERTILKTLHYKLNKPTSIQFLRRYSKIGAADVRDHNLAKYILELGLLRAHMSSVPPSEKAAAALVLAKSMLHPGKTVKQLWSPTLAHYSDYQAVQLVQAKRRLRTAIKDFHLHQKYVAITEKYSVKAFWEVSSLPVLKQIV